MVSCLAAQLDACVQMPPPALQHAAKSGEYLSLLPCTGLEECP